MKNSSSHQTKKITKNSHPALRAVTSIGELEQLAGIEDRTAFWLQYAPLKEAAFSTAVDDLRAAAYSHLVAAA